MNLTIFRNRNTLMSRRFKSIKIFKNQRVVGLKATTLYLGQLTTRITHLLMILR